MKSSVMFSRHKEKIICCGKLAAVKSAQDAGAKAPFCLALFAALKRRSSTTVDAFVISFGSGKLTLQLSDFSCDTFAGCDGAFHESLEV